MVSEEWWLEAGAAIHIHATHNKTLICTHIHTFVGSWEGVRL